MSDHIDLGGFDDDGARHDALHEPLDDVSTDFGDDGLQWLEDLVDDWDADPDDPIDPFDPDPDDPADADLEDVDPGRDPDDVAAPDAPDDAVDDTPDDDRPPAIALDELTVPAEPSAPVDAGDFSSATLHDALLTGGSADAAAVIADLDVDHVEPRLAVAAIDAAGIDARVEHSGIGTLVEAVADGHDVVLAGPNGSAWAVTSIDIGADTVALDGPDGRSSEVSLRDLADAWGLVDHEVLVVAPSATGPVQLGGDTLVVAVDAGELQPPITSVRDMADSGDVPPSRPSETG